MTASTTSQRRLSPRRLSPRRRLLFAVVAVVLAVAAGLAGFLLAHRDGSSYARPGVSQSKQGPVLLVPGYGGNAAGLDRLATEIRATGRQVSVVSLPGNGTGDLTAQARVLDTAVLEAVAEGAPSVDIVGYSAGGVVARIWARDNGGAGKARRIVTLGSPHHGTDLAAVAGVFAPRACPLACRQLEPGSAVLTGLNRGDETPDGPAWVSIWTSQDLVVSPPDTARLVGATNVVVQDVCPGRTVDHAHLPTDAVVDALVLRALAVAPFVAPTSTDCAALSTGQ